MEEKKVRGNPSFLRPVRNKQEASERGKKGGIASGKARREKRDLAYFYGQFLAQEKNIKVGKQRGIVAVMRDVLEQTDDHKARVQMLKEVREFFKDEKAVDIESGMTADNELIKGLLG